MADNGMGQGFGWDDDLTLSDGEYTLLPPGTYDYEVKSFERGWFDGSDKMAACNMAKLTITCTQPGGGATADVFVNLMLNSKVMFRVTQFFKSCGLVSADAPDGTRVSAALFQQSVGRTGRVRIKNRSYNGRDYNDVDAFLKPSTPTVTAAAQSAPAAPAAAYAAPAQPAAPAPQTWGGGGF